MYKRQSLERFAKFQMTWSSASLIAWRSHSLRLRTSEGALHTTTVSPATVTALPSLALRRHGATQVALAFGGSFLAGEALASQAARAWVRV